MQKTLRVLRLVGAGAVALVLVAAAAAYGVSAMRLNERPAVETRPLAVAIPTDSASIARGRHLATAIGKCAECHGENMAGMASIDAGPVFKLFGPNLTRGKGGAAARFADQDWSRAIRHGLRQDGRSLLFMPSEDWVGMSDTDLASLVAYIKALPPVDNVMPPSSVGPVGRALLSLGQLPLLAARNANERRPHVAPAVAPGPTREYGAYLANIGGCTGCHGPGLSGGRIPGAPPDLPIPSNITPAGIGKWTQAEFANALRTGKRPDGSTINPFMPIKWTKLMTDDEMAAVYAYLQSVPAREFGNR